MIKYLSACGKGQCLEYLKATNKQIEVAFIIR